MRVFEIDAKVLDSFPETDVGLIAAYGIDNSVAWPEVDEMARVMESDIADGTWSPFEETDPAIASWHETFRRFGTNPRRSRSSLDALSRRVAKTGRVPRINPAVDAYNLTSMRFGTPSGAFDANQLDGLVRLRFAGDNESFSPLGVPESVEFARPGEVIYSDESRVLTRHWNHRDCDQTKVTSDSRCVIFVLERIAKGAVSDHEFVLAQDSLSRILAPRSLGLFRSALNADSPVALLPDPFGS